MRSSNPILKLTSLFANVFASLANIIPLLKSLGIPSNAMSVPITGVPQANASITLTLMPAPVNSGANNAFEFAIIGYGSSTNPRYSIDTLFNGLNNLLGKFLPIILMSIFFLRRGQTFSINQITPSKLSARLHFPIKTK